MNSIDQEHLKLKERYERALRKYNRYKDVTSMELPPKPKTPPKQYPQDILDFNLHQVALYVGWRQRWREGKLERSRWRSDADEFRAYFTEVLNLVGFDSPQAAYDELWRLARAFPKLAGYHVLSAITAFARAYEVSDTPNEAWLQARLRIKLVDDHGPLEGWLVDRDYDRLDVKLVSAITDYRRKGQPFRPRHKDNDFLGKLYAAAIRAAAEHFTATRGKDIFDYYIRRSGWGGVDTYYPPGHYFHGFTCDPDLRPTRPMFWVEPDPELFNLLRFALRYAENALREREGVELYRVQGQGIRVPPEWDDALAAAITAAVQPLLQQRYDPPAPPKPQVRLDHERLTRLEQDSASIRAKLIDPALLEEATLESPASAPISESAAVVTVAVGFTAHAYSTLVGALGDDEAQLLTLITTGAPVSALEGVARASGAPLDLLIENINERALDALGDNIIDTYEEPPALIEEHHDSVRQALEEGRP